MNWALLGGSLAAVLALAGIARLLGLGGGTIEDDAPAMTAADEGLPGFVSERVWRDDRTAIVLGEGGRVAVVRRHGAQFVVREPPPPLRVTTDGAVVSMASGERLLGAFVITLANPGEARELTRMLAALPRA